MAMGKIFNPEKYGMVFCPDFKGKGKLPKKSDGFIVCSRCGGSGAVKKEKKAPEEDNITDLHIYFNEINIFHIRIIAYNLPRPIQDRFLCYSFWLFPSLW